MPASDFDSDLQDLHRKSVGRLMAADVYDADAFAALNSSLCEKAELIKGEHVISKQVLDCLLSAAKAIESRAEYIPAVRADLARAGDFYMLLDLMVIGEGCGDRQSGVPRAK
jgi:hypothetical protein